MVTKFQARHGAVAYATGAITYDTTATIDGESMTAVAEVKDITVTTPEQGVEQIPCLGSIAQTIGANARTAGTAKWHIKKQAVAARTVATPSPNDWASRFMVASRS